MLLLFPTDYDRDSSFVFLFSTFTSHIFSSTGLTAISVHRHKAPWHSCHPRVNLLSIPSCNFPRSGFQSSTYWSISLLFEIKFRGTSPSPFSFTFLTLCTASASDKLVTCFVGYVKIHQNFSLWYLTLLKGSLPQDYRVLIFCNSLIQSPKHHQLIWLR